MSINKKISVIVIIIAVLFALLGPISELVPIGALKNARFLSPLLVLPFILFNTNNNKITQSFFKSLILIYLLSIVYTILINLFNSSFTYRNVVNIVLTLTPIVFAWGITSRLERSEIMVLIKLLFFSFSLFYVIELAKGGVDLFAIMQIFNSNLVTDSYFETESGISLIMGFFTLFFLGVKNKRLALIAAFLTLLGAKRIAIFGTATAILIYYYFPLINYRNKKTQFGILFVIVGLIISTLWDSIISGRYDILIQNYTGISIDRFFMGRLGRFQNILSFIDSAPVPGLGYGLGFMENILYYDFNMVKAFHGDFYRLSLEFGFILFVTWLYNLGKYSSLNKLSLSATILLIILMQTDNVFIYNRVMFVYYFIMVYSFRRN